MDSGSAEPAPPRFHFLDIFKLPVLHPFLVILVLMFVLQVDIMMMMMVFLVILVLIFILKFCGQGAITFYTVRIFKVVLDVFISIIFVVVQMFNADQRFSFSSTTLFRTLVVSLRQRIVLLSLG